MRIWAIKKQSQNKPKTKPNFRNAQNELGAYPNNSLLMKSSEKMLVLKQKYYIKGQSCLPQNIDLKD